MKFIFWFSSFLIFYTYIGYPLFLYLFSVLFRKKVNKGDICEYTPITILIAVKNGESFIRKRIDNFLEQDYPKKLMEIIVVSDGSSDSTNDIVNEYIDSLTITRSEKEAAIPNIKLLQYEVSRGKPYALNCGIEEASGEIIIFGDVRQLFSKSAIKHLLFSF